MNLIAISWANRERKAMDQHRSEIFCLRKISQAQKSPQSARSSSRAPQQTERQRIHARSIIHTDDRRRFNLETNEKRGRGDGTSW